MYTAKIYLNSVPGGPINFILGGLTRKFNEVIMPIVNVVILY